MTRVCLTMIVRDEAEIIERCLASVTPVIDRWIICDTGSSDDTVARIERSLQGIPGRLLHHQWTDFATNRNLLLGAVADDVARGELAPDDLVLLLDADHELELDEGWIGTLDALGGDAYLVPVLSDPAYRMPYLVRAGRPWRYVGATHEYLTAAVDHERVPTDAVRVVHHADGGTRHEKFTRDLALLEAAAANDPDDPRTCFYLAQTHRDLGNTAEAIAGYLRRAELGGWDEERYVALLWAGRMQAPTNPDAAVSTWMRALDIRQGRVEAWFELARHLRHEGRHQAAWAFAERGARLEPSGDWLFVEAWLEQWGMALEAAVCAWWVGDPDAGLALCDGLLDSPSLPDSHREAVDDVRSWCSGDRGT